MAYSGSSAASSAANPPLLLARTMAHGARTASTSYPIGLGLWVYGSTDTSTAMFTSGYFSDAADIGMRQGDIVIQVGMTSTVASSQTLTIGTVGAVSTAGAAQCSTFSFISST